MCVLAYIQYQQSFLACHVNLCQNRGFSITAEKKLLFILHDLKVISDLFIPLLWHVVRPFLSFSVMSGDIVNCVMT